MSRSAILAAIVCAVMLGGAAVFLAQQHSIDKLAARNASLLHRLEQAREERKAALAKIAGNELELENLRQDSMALAELREQMKTNAPSFDAPPGFYADSNRLVYLTYSTPDPLLRSFLRSVMGSGGDSKTKGRAIFQKICAACHQQSAGGKEGVAPPLAGSEWIQASGGERLVRIVLNGLEGPVQVQGKTWNLAMPPLRANLDDDQITVVLNYIRSQWGGKNAAVIKPDLAATARQEPHPKAETAEELLHVAVQ